MEKKNFYGIKIGDIFYSDSYIKSFFQVVDLKANKQVIVRHIEREIYENLEGGYEFKVRPVPNKFVENSTFIKDNTKGIVKTVMKKEKNSYYKGKLYLSIETTKNYRKDFLLFENEELIDNCWDIWMR